MKFMRCTVGLNTCLALVILGAAAACQKSEDLNRATARRLLDESLVGEIDRRVGGDGFELTSIRSVGRGGKWAGSAEGTYRVEPANLVKPVEVTGVSASDVAPRVQGDPLAGTRKVTFTVGSVLILAAGGVMPGPRVTGDAYFRLYDDGWRLEQAMLISIIELQRLNTVKPSAGATPSENANAPPVESGVSQSDPGNSGIGAEFLGEWTGYYAPTIGVPFETEPYRRLAVTREGKRFKITYTENDGRQWSWLANYRGEKLVDVGGPDDMSGATRTLEVSRDGTLREIEEGVIRYTKDR